MQNDHIDSDRGMKAAELLDNELLRQALDAIDAEVIEQWGACPARDKDGKELLWQLYKTSQKFRNLLLGYVETGKLAADKIRQSGDKRGLLQVIRDRVA